MRWCWTASQNGRRAWKRCRPEKGLAKIEQIGEAYLDFALKEPRRYEAAFLLHSSKARRYPDDFLAGRSPAGNAQLRRSGRWSRKA